MNQSLFQKMGWVVAAALGGIMLGSGFQGGVEKTGVVDIAKVVESSDFGKENQKVFAGMKSTREGVLEFIDTYRVLTNEQAQRIRDLSLKDAAIKPEEKTELERVKADVQLADKKNKELSLKTNLTPEERNLINEYATRSQNMQDVAQRWYQQFMSELEQWTNKQKLASIDKARAAINEVAKAQGYTIIFEVGVAPYGSNDITDAALKAMNAKK